MILSSFSRGVLTFLILVSLAGVARAEGKLYRLDSGDWSGGVALSLSDRDFEDLERKTESALFRVDYSPYGGIALFAGLGTTRLSVSAPGGVRWDYEGKRGTGFVIGFEADFLKIKKAYLNFFVVGDLNVIYSEGTSGDPDDGWINEYSNRYNWREYRGALGAKVAYSSTYLSLGLQKLLIDGIVKRKQEIISNGETIFLGSEGSGFYYSNIPIEPFFEIGILLPDMWKLGVEFSGRNRGNYSIMLKMLQMYG